MKYKYLYQTRQNENREGWVNAKNRAEAYLILRKDGIRPYRVIGDDPIEWRPWAAGAIIAVLIGIIAYLLIPRASATGDLHPLKRQQLPGLREVVSAGLEKSWKGVLPTELDQYLSAYVQPGWIAIPPEIPDGFEENFRRDLETPLTALPGDNETVVALKRMVLSMRLELVAYLDRGGTIKDYLDFLEDRQNEETGFRRKACESVESAPADSREKLRNNFNMRLREMGLAEI